MPLHSSLTDPNLHEPKGVASAAEGMVYVADGAGSGSWNLIPTGWGYYSDNDSEQTFTSTAAKISINGAEATSDSDFLPRAIRGIGELWDTTADIITPIAVGDAYTARLIMPVTSRTSANYVTVDLDIGGAAGITSSIMSARVDTNRSPPFSAMCEFSFFSKSTFLTNGGQIFLTTDTGTIGVTAPKLLLTRVHAEV